MKKLAFAVLGLAGFATSALAADLDARPVLKAPPTPAPVYSWTGCYVGGGFGHGMFDHEQSTSTPAGPFSAGTADSSGRGLGLYKAGATINSIVSCRSVVLCSSAPSLMPIRVASKVILTPPTLGS